ncbi:MAG: hypothetical protein AAF518_23220 [Spirochaetota bacterium]
MKLLFSYIFQTFFLSLVFVSSLFAEEAVNKVKIQWNPIPNSFLYRIEVKTPENKKISKEVEESRISLELPPGVYQYRIGTVNRLGKTKRFTEWRELRVLRTRMPSLKPGQEKVVQLPHKRLDLLLEGENFMQSMQVFFRSKGKKLPVKQYIRHSSTRMSLVLYLNAKNVGKYDLLLVNPYGKQKEYKDFLQIVKAVEKPKKKPLKHNLFRSLVFPGTEQWYNKEYVKGNILSGASVFLFFSYWYYQQQRIQENLKFQNEIVTISLLPTVAESIPGAWWLYSRGQESRQATAQYIRIEQYLSNLLIGVFLYNTYDVFQGRYERKSGVFLQYAGNERETSRFGYTFRF